MVEIALHVDVVGRCGHEKTDGNGYPAGGDQPATAPSRRHQDDPERAEQEDDEARNVASPPAVCPTAI